MSQSRSSNEFKNKHHAMLSAAQATINGRLANLLTPGNMNIIDTAEELNFLRQHVNDSIDTLMENNELLKEVYKDLHSLQELSRDPVQKQNVGELIHKLESLKPEEDLNAEESRQFHP